jgi:hypothetical protein
MRGQMNLISFYRNFWPETSAHSLVAAPVQHFDIL